MSLPLPLYLSAFVLRTAIVLVVLVAGVRIFGRRGVGELNVLDVVMILLMGNAVQNAITQGSGSFGVGLVSAITLLLIDWGFGKVTARHPAFQKKIFGEPVIIVRDGKLDRRAMRQQGVNENQVKGAIREQGLSDLNQVRLAVLEDNGTISIIPKDGKK